MGEKKGSELPAVVDGTADKPADNETAIASRDIGRKNGRGGDEETNTREGERFYFIDNGLLYKRTHRRAEVIANFFLRIVGEKTRMDEGRTTGRVFDMCLHQDGMTVPFSIREADLYGGELIRKVHEVGGHKAIVYGSAKDLGLAAQELSDGTIPEGILGTSIGFDGNGHYVTKGMVITPKAITKQTDHQIDLSGTKFARNLAFLYPDPQTVKEVGEIIARHFLKLKRPEVTYPLLGHICLAPFTSRIASVAGRKKPALHLLGDSGCGKLFTATLALSFFGVFDDQVQSWAGTKNAIEAEGYFFRDSLYLVDDFKMRCTDQRTFVEVVQRYSDGHGRPRLNPNSTMGDLFSIRGLLLSTGEDFVSSAESDSVSARTILTRVENRINRADGAICWQKRGAFRTFLPGLIQAVIAKSGWEKEFSHFVDSYTDLVLKDVEHLSNGLRMASNWALNGWGFAQCVRFLCRLGVIGHEEMTRMAEDHRAIAIANLKDHAEQLIQNNPVAIFFDYLGQEVAAGKALIHGLGTLKTGKPVGKANLKAGLVDIFPDEAIEVVMSRLRAIGERCPFTKNSLRDALANERVIAKVKDGRWTVQVRLPDGTRHQAWEIGLAEFKRRSGL